MEDGEDPQVWLFQSGEGCRDVGPRGPEVVHAEVRARHGDEDQRHPDEACERQVQGRGGADRDGDRDEELRDRGAEVAAGGVESEGVTLLRGGVEERDVRHRARDLGAAEVGEIGDQEESAEGPVTAAEARNHERVGDPQRRPDEARHGDEPEDLARRQLKAGRGQRHDHDRPTTAAKRRTRGTRRRPTTAGCGRRWPCPLRPTVGRSRGSSCRSSGRGGGGVLRTLLRFRPRELRRWSLRPGGVAVSGRGSAPVTGGPPAGSEGGTAPRNDEVCRQHGKEALSGTA